MITFNEAKERYDAPWGWIKFSLNKEDQDKVEVEVNGPCVDKWFKLELAVQVVEMFHKLSGGTPNYLQLAIAINGQYAAWKGLQDVLKELELPGPFDPREN